MAGLTRKNLLVDADNVRELARQRGMTESQAVREAVEFALAAEEINAAIRELHESGGIADVFGRLPDETEPPRTADAVVREPLRYSMAIEWSDEDQVFVVRLPEWGDPVHTHGATYEEAVQCGRDLIEGLVNARRASGDPLPDPRTFAGA